MMESSHEENKSAPSSSQKSGKKEEPSLLRPGKGPHGKSLSSQQQAPYHKKKASTQTLFRTFERLEPFGAVRYKGVLVALKSKTVRERFKAIDGPIYDENKPLGQKFAELFVRKEVFQTSTRSGHILRSQNIPPPKDRNNSIQQGNTFDPVMALKELTDLQAKYKAEEFAKMKMKEGKQGQLIAKILEKAKIEIIRDLNLSLYPLNQQKMILESIEGLEPRELSLRFSPLVTFTYLKKLNIQNLRVLNLRGCENLSDSFLIYLQNQAPTLRELNLSNIKNLMRFAKSKSTGFFQPVIFKPLDFFHLEQLSLSGCENLEEIHLRAISLQQLRINHCRKLTIFEVDAPNLACLSGLESPGLGEKALALPLIAMMKFRKLRYEEFEVEQKNKMIDPYILKRFLKSDTIIEFNNVKFNYGDDQDRLVLKSVSFQLKMNKRLAIVGEPGSGKSTIIKLLLRVVDASSGSITINDDNIKKFAPKDLRTFIGVVSLTDSLFNASIYDNIVCGNQDVSIDDVIEASKASFIHEFIQGLPDGYNTIVGQRGIALSLDQCQKISLARIILRKPLIRILDDAEGVFYSLTEKSILKSLEYKPFLTIITFSRPHSTIIHADEIIYLRNGIIEARGIHENLIRLNGRYAAFWNTQSAPYKGSL